MSTSCSKCDIKSIDIFITICICHRSVISKKYHLLLLSISSTPQHKLERLSKFWVAYFADIILSKLRRCPNKAFYSIRNIGVSPQQLPLRANKGIGVTNPYHFLSLKVRPVRPRSTFRLFDVSFCRYTYL